MKKKVFINEKIKKFNNKIIVPGDKSISIRFILMASMAVGKSTAYNILKSEDVLNSLYALKKLSINYKIYKNNCEIYGKGLNGLDFKNNTVINAGNSGTLARLIFGLLINSKNLFGTTLSINTLSLSDKTPNSSVLFQSSTILTI